MLLDVCLDSLAGLLRQHDIDFERVAFLVAHVLTFALLL
jgi:hypothetical protein